MLENPYVKNILSALVIVVGGFMLLNITFIFYALITNLILWFLPRDFVMTNQWFMPFMMIAIGIIIAIISKSIFRSKLPTLLKATFTAVPIAVALVTTGIFLYPWPAVAVSAGGLISASTLYYLYRNKRSWLYFFAVVLVSVSLLLVTLTGTDI